MSSQVHEIRLLGTCQQKISMFQTPETFLIKGQSCVSSWRLVFLLDPLKSKRRFPSRYNNWIHKSRAEMMNHSRKRRDLPITEHLLVCAEHSEWNSNNWKQESRQCLLKVVNLERWKSMNQQPFAWEMCVCNSDTHKDRNTRWITKLVAAVASSCVD